MSKYFHELVSLESEKVASQSHSNMAAKQVKSMSVIHIRAIVTTFVGVPKTGQHIIGVMINWKWLNHIHKD